MNLNAYKQWRGVVDDHYGDLDRFMDAHTVRIQLKGLRELIADHERIAGEIEDEDARADFNAVFETETILTNVAIAELSEWLRLRGLEE